ncbi:MAG: hypothetical protein RQ760_05060 [Sedimentisphaerales bacterium]|nr:hypothetical protein [Sedimentisphaerales bacterium]
MKVWIYQTLNSLICLAAVIIPAIAVFCSLRLKLRNRVRRLGTSVEEHEKRQLYESKLRDLQSKIYDLQKTIDRLVKQFESPYKETTSIPSLEQLDSLLLALGGITNDIKRNDSGSPRDVVISPTVTQGRTDLLIPIDELHKQPTPMTRKKPNRKKKKDFAIS